MTTALVTRALQAGPAAVGGALIVAPEDQWFDRKSARIAPRDLANSLIAFANAEGGTIVVGLHAGSIEGTDGDARRRNAQLQANIDFCLPPVHARSELIECVNAVGEPDHLLVVEVDPSEVVHSNVRDEVYLRVGDEDRRLSFLQRQELLYDKGQSTYESRTAPGVGDEALDPELTEEYARIVGAADPMRVLDARGLVRSGEVTIAGCLLFARQPQQLFPEAFVRVLRYRGRERGTGARQQLLSDRLLEGPIPTMLVVAQDQVREVQPMRRALTAAGRFGDVPLIPEDAWLEGLVNAVVHRSYSAAGDHIRVEVFDDRIEISSPGRFPGLVDLKDPSAAARFARNPRIARVCSDWDFGQELGEGIRRMFDEMRQAGLADPLYRQTSGSVQLTLFAEPVDRALQERLPEHARAITAALRERDRLSTGEIAETLGVSRPTAQRELAELREAGVIRWVGKSPRDPRAYWQLGTT